MAYITAPDFRMKGIEWELDRPSQINVSAYTARRSVLQNPWHGRWRAKVELATVQGESGFRALRSFFARCEGQVNVFRVYATVEAQNSNFGVIVASTAAAGATTMSISGYATALTEGQYFTVNGQLCVCIANQSGASLTFEPPLRAQATAGTFVVTSRPYALVSMAASSTGWSIGAARRYGAAFTVEEAIGDADGAAPETLSQLFAAGETGGWYDPSDLASMWQDSAGTIAAAVNSPVGKINDKSGRGNHLTQATAASCPILRQSGSLYYLEFDGVDDSIGAAFTAVQPFDRISAIRQISWTADDYVFDGNANGGSLGQQVVTPELSLYAGTGWACTNAEALVGTDKVVSERFNGASSTLTMNNGSASTGNPGTTANPAGLRMGSAYNGIFNSNVRIYGALMIGRTLTASEVATVRNYMAAKSGVVL